METTFGVLCLIPPILAIVLALITKQTILSDGREAGQITAHGVQDVGQLGPGYPHGIGDGAHDGAQHQAGLGIAEDERAQAGDNLALLGGVDDLGDPGGEGLRQCKM